MTGTIELDRDGKTLLIGFPYREDLVDEVRNIPGRRWDRGSKMWRVPATHAELVVSTFMKHGFHVSSDVSGIVAGIGGSPPATETETSDETPAGSDPKESPGLTVSQLNYKAQAALRGAFPKRVHVVGEVVDFDKNQGRPHAFFSLVEKDGSGRKIAATVDAALFANTQKRILPAIEAKGLTLRDGIEIMVEARVDIYPATGRFQLIVEDIKPEFTLGQLALGRDQILAELRQAGLDKLNASLGWPIPSLRIGVLTSTTSDGWNDFLREIEASKVGFELAVYPVRVQGEALKPTMLAGLQWFEEHADEFDALCILRGGGSRTDLAWFDDREVALAVAKHPLKILCGIGHERDRSVLDEISASQKTPTAAAAFLIDQIEFAERAIIEQSRRLRDLTQDLLDSARERLTDAAHGLRRIIHGRLVRDGARLENSAARLAATIGQRIATATQRLQAARARLTRGAATRLEREAARIDTWATRQRLLDPTRVLQRGYAIVRSTDGAIVKQVSQVSPGDEVEIAFRDGHAKTRVEATEAKTKGGN